MKRRKWGGEEQGWRRRRRRRRASASIFFGRSHVMGVSLNWLVVLVPSMIAHASCVSWRRWQNLPTTCLMESASSSAMHRSWTFMEDTLLPLISPRSLAILMYLV